MDFSIIIPWLTSLHPLVPVVLAVLGSLSVLGAAYVKLTPSTADDAWYAKLEAIPMVGSLLKVLVSFSPISRKP